MTTAHVGYWLVDDGRAELEGTVGYTPPPARAAASRDHSGIPTRCTSAAMAIFTPLALAVVLVALAGRIAARCRSCSRSVAVPASEIGVSAVNQLVTLLMPPRVCPEARVSRDDGIPEE